MGTSPAHMPQTHPHSIRALVLRIRSQVTVQATTNSLLRAVRTNAGRPPHMHTRTPAPAAVPAPAALRPWGSRRLSQLLQAGMREGERAQVQHLHDVGTHRYARMRGLVPFCWSRCTLWSSACISSTFAAFDAHSVLSPLRLSRERAKAGVHAGQDSQAQLEEAPICASTADPTCAQHDCLLLARGRNMQGRKRASGALLDAEAGRLLKRRLKRHALPPSPTPPCWAQVHNLEPLRRCCFSGLCTELHPPVEEWC